MGKKIAIVLLIIVGIVGYLNKDRILGYFQKESRTINSSEVKLLFTTQPTLSELLETLEKENII